MFNLRRSESGRRHVPSPQHCITESCCSKFQTDELKVKPEWELDKWKKCEVEKIAHRRAQMDRTPETLTLTLKHVERHLLHVVHCTSTFACGKIENCSAALGFIFVLDDHS